MDIKKILKIDLRIIKFINNPLKYVDEKYLVDNGIDNEFAYSWLNTKARNSMKQLNTPPTSGISKSRTKEMNHILKNGTIEQKVDTLIKGHPRWIKHINQNQHDEILENLIKKEKSSLYIVNQPTRKIFDIYLESHATSEILNDPTFNFDDLWQMCTEE